MRAYKLFKNNIISYFLLAIEDSEEIVNDIRSLTKKEFILKSKQSKNVQCSYQKQSKNVQCSSQKQSKNVQINKYLYS